MPLGDRHLGHHFVLTTPFFELADEPMLVEDVRGLCRLLVEEPCVLHFDGQTDGEKPRTIGEGFEQCRKDCLTIGLELFLCAEPLDGLRKMRRDG